MMPPIFPAAPERNTPSDAPEGQVWAIRAPGAGVIRGSYRWVRVEVERLLIYRSQSGDAYPNETIVSVPVSEIRQ